MGDEGPDGQTAQRRGQGTLQRRTAAGCLIGDRWLLGRQLQDFLSQFDDIDRAIWPVILPADNEVALVGVVAVLAKVGCSKFKLDPCLRPQVSLAVVKVLAFAVWKSNLHGLDVKTQLTTDHAEQIHDSLLIDRSMAESAKINWLSIKLRWRTCSAWHCAIDVRY